MGEFSFQIPDPTRLCEHSIATAHLIGFDGVPWEGMNHFDEDWLRIERDDHESARLVIPWNVDEQGAIALSTGTLVERREPYQLDLEIARGTLSHIRNQIWYWQTLGFTLPEVAANRLARATECFIEAALCQNDRRTIAEKSNIVISESFWSLAEIVDAYVAFWNSRESIPNNIWHGSRILPGRTEPARSARATTVVAPFHWKHIEPNQNEFDWSNIEKSIHHCRQNDLRVLGGHLFDLGTDAVPDWLYLWQEDDDALESFVERYTTHVVQRFQQQVQGWQCHVGCDTDPGLMLTEEQRLRLAVRSIEAVRRADAKAPLLVVIDQPWAECMARQTNELTPIQFADMLVRSELNVTGFGLRLRFGTSLSDTLFRDVLEFGKLIDGWSTLGKPLIVFLESTMPHSSLVFDETIRSMTSLLSTKRGVQGIVWDTSLSRFLT